MKRWTRMAILCALIAAITQNSSVNAAIGNGNYIAETSAINVVKHFPDNMSVGISPETPLTVEFGGAVNQSFYQNVSFNLFNGTELVNGELFYNPAARQVMFKASKPLAQGKTYTAQVSYYDGLGRTSEKVWSFQTADLGEAALPQTANVPQSNNSSNNNAQQGEVKSLVLTNASMGIGSISPEKPLEVSFSEALDVASLKAAPVQLYENNRPVGIDYRLSKDMKTITVSPRKSLKTNVPYAVTIDKTIASTTGKRLAKKTLIPFKLLDSSKETAAVSQHELEERPAETSKIENPFATQTTVAINPAASSYAMSQYQVSRSNNQQPAPAAEPVQLIGLAPQNGAKVTNLAQPVTIGFSEEVKAETLNEFTFRLEDDFGPVPAKIHYFQGRKQATLTPVGLLDAEKNYRIIVTQGITDVYGRPIKSGINSMFATTTPTSAPAMPQMPVQTMTTQATPQREAQELEAFDNSPNEAIAANNQYQQNYSRGLTYTPRELAPNRSSYGMRQEPRQQHLGMATANREVMASAKDEAKALKAFKVSSIFPGLNSDNIARKAKIAVHFSEPCDPKTVNNINISVFANQARVDGKVTYDRRNNRAIFEPSRPLDAKTEHKVIVSDKILSKSGEHLSQRFSWSFQTTSDSRNHYVPTAARTAEADSAFYIPLVDSKVKMTPLQSAALAAQRMSASSTSTSSFTYVPSKH